MSKKLVPIGAVIRIGVNGIGAMVQNAASLCGHSYNSYLHIAILGLVTSASIAPASPRREHFYE